MSLNTETFIKKASEIHGNKYEYSLVEYRRNNINVKIICPIHGLFTQKPYNHLYGKAGCPKCGKERKKNKRSLTNKDFIERATEMHGDKYNYNVTTYKNYSTKIIIGCPEHGSFEQWPGDHLKGYGCPKCGHAKKSKKISLTTKTFIKKANEIHNNKYDYSLVDYIRNNLPATIICPEHGEFIQKPHTHLYCKAGCPECGGTKKLTKRQFIERAYKQFGKKYDYSKVNYKNSKTLVEIVCPIHGSFNQKPNNHLMGHQCPKCTGRFMNKEYFIEKASKIHNGFYDYIGVVYKTAAEKVKIICPKHGEFMQAPASHLDGQGCPSCAAPGFNPNKPAVLYYLKDKETDFYKIGITNKTLVERFGKEFCSKRAMILSEQTYENGQDAYLAEQELLTAFGYYRTTNESWPEEKGGKTEFFNEDILKMDKKNRRMGQERK